MKFYKVQKVVGLIPHHLLNCQSLCVIHCIIVSCSILTVCYTAWKLVISLLHCLEISD